MANAGLETETVHILDKGQPSIKGVKGTEAGKRHATCLDLVLCLKRKRESGANACPIPSASYVQLTIRSEVL